jgi:hypothetical protein
LEKRSANAGKPFNQFIAVHAQLITVFLQLRDGVTNLVSGSDYVATLKKISSKLIDLTICPNWVGRILKIAELLQVRVVAS